MNIVHDRPDLQQLQQELQVTSHDNLARYLEWTCSTCSMDAWVLATHNLRRLPLQLSARWCTKDAVAYQGLGATLVTTEERAKEDISAAQLPRPRLGLNCVGGSSSAAVAKALM